jgi:ribosomal protein S18 acetylase RimI-like enzyme
VFDGPALAARGLSLRPARDADLPFLRALFETARPDAAILAAWPEQVRRPFLDQQFQFQTIHYARVYPDADRLLVLADGGAIGRMILWRQPEQWCVVDIALLPAWRSQGIGTLLLQRIKAAAAAAAARCVRLSVDVRNPARRLYERLGFATVEEGDGMANVEMAWQAPAPSAQLNTA